MAYAKKRIGAPNRMKSPRSIQQKVMLDVMLVAAAIGLLILAIPPSKIGTSGNEVPPVGLGFYLIYLGVLFLLSYFYSDASYIFRTLIWVCENFSHPRGRRMAFFYFGLSFLLGSCALLATFHVLR